MCCFSQPVKHVSKTRIFARLTGRGTQYLAYAMRYAADHALAMLLPLPVRQPVMDSEVIFLDLKGYPDFFNEMDRGFPDPMSRGGVPGAGAPGGGGGFRPLPVESVGDFEASFVPTLNDFARLDRRFTIPRATWDQIPAYRDFGFAVFKLKAGVNPLGVHPMAFEFPTRIPNAIFLPTVHIHDGQVHSTEHFDHQLYIQDRRLRATNGKWVASTTEAVGFVDASRAKGIVDPTQYCLKRTMRGTLPNQDVVVRVA